MPPGVIFLDYINPTYHFEILNMSIFEEIRGFFNILSDIIHVNVCLVLFFTEIL